MTTMPTPRMRPRPKRNLYGHAAGSFWINRIQRALADRQIVEADWEENEKLANSSVVEMPGMGPGESIYVNHVKVKVDQLVAELAFNNPRFQTKPRRPDDERNHRFAAAYANLASDIVEMGERLGEASEDAAHCTFGYLKVGWKLEDVDIRHWFDENGNDVWDDQSRSRALSLLKPEQDTVQIGTGPTTYVVDPVNFVRSRGSTRLRNAAWCAERIFMRYEDLKLVPGIKNVQKVKPNASPKVSEYGGRSMNTIATGHRGDRVTPEKALADPDDELVELWEVWDLRYMQTTLVAVGVDDALREVPWVYDIGRRYPYIEMCFSRVRSQPYPLSFVSMLKHLSIAKNKIESYKYRHVKVSTPRTVYNTQMMDPEDAEQFCEGEIGSFVGVDGNPAEAATVLAGPAMSTDIAYVDQSLQTALDVVSSDPDYGRSGQAPAGQTATVANIQNLTKNSRVKFMRKKVEKAAIEWATLVNLMARQFLDFETHVRVSGTDALHENLVPVTKGNLDGEWDYEIVTDSMQDKDVQAERQQTTDLVNVLSPLFAPGTNLNGREIVRRVLEKWNVPNIDKILGETPDAPPADPAEENMLMLHGTSVPVSKRENFQEHMLVHQAAIEQLKAAPEPDLEAIDRLVKHLEQTQATAMQVMIEAQVKAALEQQMMQQMAAGEGGFKRGPGAGGPAATGPARPRNLAERQTDTSAIVGAAQRDGGQQG